MTDVFVIEKPADCRYIPDRSWRFQPEIAEARSYLAQFYRRLRREGRGGVARLTYSISREAGRKVATIVADAILNGV